MIRPGKRNETFVVVDGVKVEGTFLLLHAESKYLEVSMTSPYRGVWMTTYCIHHQSPNMLIFACMHWAARLKLELEYRKMKAFKSHYIDGYEDGRDRPRPPEYQYPDI
jgi:hypothetical protein